MKQNCYTCALRALYSIITSLFIFTITYGQTAQLDSTFNAAGIFSGIPGTAQFSATIESIVPAMAQGIAVSPNGSIVLGGSQNIHEMNICFAAANITKSGAILWTTAPTNLFGPGLAAATDVAIDGSGCIYLGGATTLTVSGAQFAVAQLSETGIPLWTTVLPALGDGSQDVANAIVLDNSGCIYLGGFSSFAIGVDDQFVAAKISRTGLPLWTTVIPHLSSGSSDQASDIALDSSGCIYLGGSTKAYSGTYQFATVKLSSSGAPLWSAIVPHLSSGSSDEAQGIALNNDTCIYLAGTTQADMDNKRCVAAKLSSTGVPLWTTIVPYLSSGSSDEAQDIVLDTSGCIYLGGTSRPLSDNNHFAAIKLSETGVPVWTAVLPSLNNGSGDDDAFSITLDTSGCLYLGGSNSFDPKLKQFAAAVLDSSSGNLLITDLIPFFAPVEASLLLTDVTVDTADNIITAGTIFAIPTFQFFAAKFTPTGVPLWMVTPALSSIETAFGIATDASDAVYLGGTINATTNSQFAALKLSDTGALLWTAVVAAFSSGSRDNAYGISLNTAGCVYLAGNSISDDEKNAHIAAAKLSQTGALIWTALIPHLSSGSDDTALAIIVDSSDYVYLGGTTNSEKEDNQMAAVKLSTTGISLWTAIIPHMNTDSADTAYGIALNASGSAYLGGTTESFKGSAQFAIANINKTGTLQWTSVLPHLSSGSSDFGTDIALDEVGNIYMAGSTEVEKSGPQLVAIKLNNERESIWQFIVPDLNCSPGLLETPYASITLDSTNAVILANGTGESVLNSLGGLAKLQQISPSPTPSALLQFFVAMAAG